MILARKNQDLTPTRRLFPVLGVGFGLAVAIGTTIGAGIFRTPGEVAAHLPSPWLVMAAWTIGGLYALVGAIQIAELGTMIPRSGGQYAPEGFGIYSAAAHLPWFDFVFEHASRVASARREEEGFRARVGMPRAVRDLQAEIDRVAGTAQWVLRDGQPVRDRPQP